MKANTPNTIDAIRPIPAAKPSIPSIKLYAFIITTTLNTVNNKLTQEARLNIPQTLQSHQQ